MTERKIYFIKSLAELVREAEAMGWFSADAKYTQSDKKMIRRFSQSFDEDRFNNRYLDVRADFKSGRLSVISLCDDNTQPEVHLFIERNGELGFEKKITDIIVRDNKDLRQKWREFIPNFVNDLDDIAISHSIAQKHDFIKSNNLYHDLHNLQDGFVISGNLDLTDRPHIDLPKGLIIEGNLKLNGWQGEYLPENLFVHQDMWLNEKTALTELPEGIIVGFDLDLNGTKVRKIGKRSNFRRIKIDKIFDRFNLPDDIKFGKGYGTGIVLRQDQYDQLKDKLPVLEKHQLKIVTAKQKKKKTPDNRHFEI